MHVIPRRRWASVILLAAVATLVVPSASGAASAAGPPTRAPAPAKAAASGGPPLVNDPRLSPALRAVPVSSPDYDAAQGDYAADWASLGDAHRRERAATAELGVLGRTEDRLAADLAMATRRHDKSARRIEQLRRSLATLAVAVYENGSASGAGPSSLAGSGTTGSTSPAAAGRTVGTWAAATDSSPPTSMATAGKRSWW